MRLAARDELGRVGGRCLFVIYLWGKPQLTRSIEWGKMRRGQESHIDTLLKRPVRETWNERKSIITFK